MKEFGMKFKRALSMCLAVLMVLTASNITALIPVHAVEGEQVPQGNKVTLGVLIKENFGELSKEEIAVITSGYLSADKTYSYLMPEAKDNLISVDEKSGTVTAKSYTDQVYKTVWVPVSFDLTNGSAVIAGYDDLPMAASGDAFTGKYELEKTNPGNSFTVEVTYSLDLTMAEDDLEAQKEMLGASSALARDIALMQYLDAVGVIGDDQELADKIIGISGGLIKDPTKVYADTILEFLAMDLEQLGNQSAVDLIYQLVGGIEIPTVDFIDFETGEVVMSKENLRLGKDGRTAATSLYNQKKNNGGLDLVKYLNAHGSDNYLKMLAVYGSDLKSALNGNYSQIDDLVNSSGGLKYVSDRISVLLEDFQAVRESAYAELNSYLESSGKSVNNIAQLRELIAELEGTGNEAYTEINKELAKLDADTKAMLAKYNGPEKVENAADLAALKNALVAAYKDVIATINDAIAALDPDVQSKLIAKGAPKKVTMADTSSYQAFVDSGDQDLKDLDALKGALEAVLSDALSEADKQLQGLDAATLEKLNKAGAPAAIKSVADMDALCAAMDAVKAEAMATINAELTEIYSTNAQLKQKLLNAGAPEKINGSEDVTKLENALTSVRKDLVSAAIKEANEQLIEMHATNGSLMYMMQIPTKISTETELRNLVSRLNQLSSLLPAETLQDMNDAITALDTLDEVIAAVGEAKAGVEALEAVEGTLKSASDALNALKEAIDGVAAAKSALATVKPYISTALNAYEQLATLNEKVLPLLKDVEAGLVQLEEGIETLEEKQSQLNMLIMVMQAFCDTVKPVYDAFAADSWSADKILTADAHYKDLYDWVEGATEKNYIPKDVMHVTNTVVSYKMDMYDVTVEFKASVVNPAKADSAETINLPSTTDVVTLTKGATAQDILNEIAAKVDEDGILSTWGISTANYDRVVSALPEALSENITYTVSYVPKQLTVSFGEGYAAGTADMKVPFGYRMTLPALAGDVTKEYTYQVNDQKNLDQGTIVTITENTLISREEGAISAKQYLTDLVINTTPGMDTLVKNILQNQALNRGQAISIRVPGKEQVVVTPAADASSTTISALPYGSRVGNKNWIAKEAIIDGVTVQIVDGIYVEINNPGFGKVVVNYELALTAAALGITDEQLVAAMNIPYELVNDYKFQKNTLDALATNDPSTGKPEDDIMGLLTMLNATDYVMESPSKMTLKEALGKIEDLNNLLGLGLGSKAVAAAKKMYNLIPDAGYVPLYYTLQQYNEQGIIHYYKNEAVYVSQITELNDIMKELVADEGFIKLIPASYMETFELIQTVLNDAAALQKAENGVNKDLINVSSPYLSTLLAALEAAGETELTHYTAAPSELIWLASVEQPGPSKRTASMTVNFGGVEKTESMIVEFGDVLTYAQMVQWAMDMAKTLGLSEEIAMFYVGSYNFSEDISVGQDVELSATWELKEYQVKVGDEVIGTVTYNDRQINLAGNTNPNFQNRYYINGQLYSAGEHALTLAQLKALAEGKLTITKETIDLMEANLIKLIDNMNGAAVLTRDENGEYAIILPVNPTSVQNDLSSFVIALFMTDYKYIGLGGNEFYSGQFHIQALIDAFMNSGFGTDSILKLIDSNGNITNKLVLADGTTVLNSTVPASAGNLGGIVMETTMDFGNDAENVTATKFYITLNGSVSELKQVRSGLAQAKNAGISFACKDGKVNLSVKLPDQAYGSYLAALSLVGKVDLANVNDVDASIAIGYFVDMLAPVVSDDVTVDTLSNTMNMLGVSGNLDAYESYWNAVKKYCNPEQATYTKDTCTLPIDNIPINALVDAMQGYVSKLPLPEGFSVDLTKLIYEYDDPATAEDDETSGLDLKTAITLENLNTKYAALYLDIRAAGVLNKFGMWTESELLAGSDDFAGTSVVVLVDDVVGNLYFNTTTVLDLNGKKVTGNIVAGAKANLIIIDSAYRSPVIGTVTGQVSGNVSILEGKYESDVSAFLDNGYVQNEDGRVVNKLYTVTTDENYNITVTINASPDEIRELANKQGLVDLAIEMAAGLVINNYNNAGLSINGGKIYEISVNDVVGLYAKGDKLDNAIDTTLSWISASDLADLVTTLITDLTNFAALDEALKGDGVIMSYATSVAPWKMEFVYMTDGDYLSMNVGASDETEESTLHVAITGDLQDNLGDLAGTLKDNVSVDVKVDFEDIVRDENSVINVIGSFKGVIEVDFTNDPNYTIMMAVILADGADSALKAKLVAGIEAYYATGSLGVLESVMKGMTVKQICDSLCKNARGEAFTSQVNNLALSAQTKQTIKDTIDNTEMGYHHFIDAAGVILRQLEARGLLKSITESGRTLGSMAKADEEGEYFGFSGEKLFAGERHIFRDYALGYELDITELAVKIRLFHQHTHCFEEIVAEQFLKTEATCLTPAEYYKSCACGMVSEETFTDGVLGAHALVNVSSKPATTTAEGNIQYWYCSVCGKYFADAEGEKEIAKADTVIAALPTVSAPVLETSDKVYGFIADAKDNMLILDAIASGITVEQLREIIIAAVTNDFDGKVEVTVTGTATYRDSELICTGTQIILTAENVDGVKVSATYDVVVLGDTNCNGRVEAGDAVKIKSHYQGVQELTGLALLAADSNRNGRLEAGDAIKIKVKFQTGENYVSALK